MSIAPKFAVFGQSDRSKPAVVSSIKLPDVGNERPQTEPFEPAKGIGYWDRRPEQFRQRTPEEGNKLKETGREQRKQGARGERRERFSRAEVKRSHQTNHQSSKLVPPSESMPVWLTSLMRWQRGSSVVTFLLVSATLAVYGSTVYTQQLWNREYRQLETLQIQQRQLTAASEVLKNQLAQQAEQQNTGLVPATPNTNLFLPPAPEQAKQPPSSTSELNGTSNQQLAPRRVGY